MGEGDVSKIVKCTRHAEDTGTPPCSKDLHHKPDLPDKSRSEATGSSVDIRNASKHGIAHTKANAKALPLVMQP